MTKRRQGKLDLCTFKIWMEKFRFMLRKNVLGDDAYEVFKKS